MSLFVGRTAEKILLKQALVSIKPELIAIYGRRRVGKTFLVRETYKKNITFEFSGVYRSGRANQLKNFYLKLSLVYPKTTKPKDWLEAFHQLSLFINSLRTKKKKVIFIDEFPWLDTKKSGFQSGGRLSKTLKELEESGFISRTSPFRGIKDSIYRLSDEYSMFYLKFIEKNAPSNTEKWLSLQNKQSYKIWSGFSFENLCIKHVDQIKEGLKISGINSSHSSWIGTGATGGGSD